MGRRNWILNIEYYPSGKVDLVLTTWLLLSMKTEETPQHSNRLIALGASAGGLEALKQFFENVPEECPHTFVVIQHLSPDYKSLMAELLAKNTELPIAAAKHEMKILAGHIYLIPPGKNMTVNNGFLKLTDKPTGHRLNLPIDIFFQSLAKERGEEAVGVILSGSGSDGTIGSRAIKEAGGMILVQRPEEAKFDGMPKSAIQTGLVDYVLPVDQIPGELLDILDQPTDRREAQARIQKDEQTLHRVLSQVEATTTLDFSTYRRPTLARRIERRMGVNRCQTLDDYLQYIYDNPSESEVLSREFLIGVTRFFRDAEVWETLAEKVIVDLVREKAEKGEALRVWCAGCSTGEEVYTLAMLLREEIERQDVLVDVKIFATDVQREPLDMASAGSFKASVVQDLDPERLAKWFTPQGDDSYVVAKVLRNMVVFTAHNLLRDPPFKNIDIVVCRNLLIYLNQESHRKVLRLLHFSLRLHGILLMGSSEMPSDRQHVLQEVDRKARIFRNLEEARTLEADMLFDSRLATRNPQFSTTRRRLLDFRMAEVMNEALCEELEIATLYIDDRFNILNAVGRVRRFLELPEKGFSVNLQSMLPRSASVVVSTAVRKARQGNQAVFKENLPMKLPSGETELLKLLVRPFELEASSGGASHYMLAFFKPPAASVSQPLPEVHNFKPAEFESKLIQSLEDELNTTQENLQSTIEEVETTNEELQATNEELLASNEELQSTNEELQSVNEELHTVNSELQQRIEDLARLNSDMDNFLKSSMIGTIFVGKSLRIRRFTAEINSLFDLNENDIGRSLSNFHSKIEEGAEPKLIDLVKQVLAGETVPQREVRTKDDRLFLQQILPYNNQRDVLEGAIINFVEMTGIRKAEARADRSEALFQTIYEQSPVGFPMVDLDGTVTKVNPGLCLMFAHLEEELVGSNVLDWFHPNDKDEYLGNFEKMVANEGLNFAHFHFFARCFHRSGTTLYLQTDTKLVAGDTGSPPYVSIVIQDVTATHRAREALQEIEKRFGAIFHSMYQFIGLLSINGTLLEVNKTALTFGGLQRDDVIGKPFWEALWWCGDDARVKQLKESIKLAAAGETVRYDVVVEGAAGPETIDFSLKPMRNAAGNVALIIPEGRIVSDLRRAEAEANRSQERFRILYENSPVMHLSLDAKSGAVVACNRRLIDRFGIGDAETLIGKPLSDLVELGHYASVELAIQSASATGRPEPADICLTYGSMTPFSALLYATCGADEEAGAALVEVTLVDTSDLHELMRSNRELEQFAYITSHDLQEPLRAITSFSSLLGEDYHDQLDTRGRECLGFINQSASRMSQLIRALLDYSRIGQERTREDANLQDVVDVVKNDLQSQIEASKATIESTTLPTLSGYPNELRLLLQNLISNAIKFRSKSRPPVIQIHAKENADSWNISISDNGIGIAAKHHEKIFQIFQRLHPQSQYEGTGIGLSQCRRIMELHSGTITVAAKPGTGTTFHLNFPK